MSGLHPLNSEPWRRRVAERLAAAALESLLNAIDANDPDTGRHARRVAAAARTLAEFADGDAMLLLRVERVAIFHDIGKIHQALLDIVQKGDGLTNAERRTIRTHPARGELVVAPLARFYPELPAGVRGHHERWDGKGYPDGLAGSQIPIEARIVSIVDVFDALTHRRPYRDAAPRNAAEEYIAAGRGTRFEPELVDLFLMPPVLAAVRQDSREALRRPARNPSVGQQAKPESRRTGDVPVPEVSFRWRHTAS
ncbi:MAG TPA: HD domain-containing phosphohydrolase [Gemmatimonadaceae bacterium]|nr:HD domain-containing phosphohydrolase [Gemmatimonadaceae bacterium]